MTQGEINIILALYKVDYPIDSWDREFVANLERQVRYNVEKWLTDKQRSKLIQLLYRYQNDPNVQPVYIAFRNDKKYLK